MKHINATDKIYVGKSKIKGAGRGVFARVGIQKGELIERCPVIPIPEHDVAGLSHSILLTYFYFFGKKKERILLTLGYGSLYNHTYTPNTMYKEQFKMSAIDFIALVDIQRGEEITVNYAQGKKQKHPLWFDISST